MKRVGNSLLFPQNWPSSISQYPSTVRETASQFWHNLTVYSCSTRSILQCSSKRQQQKCIDVEVTQRNGIQGLLHLGHCIIRKTLWTLTWLFQHKKKAFHITWIIWVYKFPEKIRIPDYLKHVLVRSKLQNSQNQINSKISQLANFTQRETNLQKITLKLQDILYFYKIKSMEI